MTRPAGGRPPTSDAVADAGAAPASGAMAGGAGGPDGPGGTGAAPDKSQRDDSRRNDSRRGGSGRGGSGRRPGRWVGLGALILVQVGYPLTHGTARAGLVVATVSVGFVVSVGHAVATRGVRTASALVVVVCAGGLAVEALGVHTGVPFGRYGYSGALGPRLFGVPVVIPLAWTWMAWPAWLAAGRLTHRPAARIALARIALARIALARIALARIALAGIALAAWDLFLDPQMVAEGYWHWRHPAPGLAGIPYTNYLGWLAVAVLMMASFAVAAGRSARLGDRRADAPMSALYLWTYLSSVLAHAAFLRLPASAAAGAVGMGLVAVPLAVSLQAGDRAGCESTPAAPGPDGPGTTAPGTTAPGTTGSVVGP